MKKKILLFIGITMFAHNVGLFRLLTYQTTDQKKSALHDKTAIGLANGKRTFEK